jgi:hypothetical protein
VRPHNRTLRAGQHVRSRHVSGNADTDEDITQPKVQDQFSGRSGIDAPDDDGQGVLPFAGGADLATPIASEPPSCAKPLVALSQNL